MRTIKRMTKKPTNIQHREHSRSVDGACEMKCEYLSDLRALSAGQKEKLADVIESIESSDEDLHDWNDALEYLTDAQSKGTAAEAKAALVRALQKK